MGMAQQYFHTILTFCAICVSCVHKRVKTVGWVVLGV